MTLVEFLLARIAEDEEVARAASHLAPSGPDPAYVSLVDPLRVMQQRFDPPRVLAECEAKRRIVAWHRLIDGLDTEDNPVRGCGNCIASGAVAPYLIAGPCMTVRFLALSYADHPDYQLEWRP